MNGRKRRQRVYLELVSRLPPRECSGVVGKNGMAQAVENTLNRLIAIHARSLPVYVADAAPWGTSQDMHAQDVIDMIAADQLLTVDRLADEVMSQGGAVKQGAFPMEFTGLHDLSIGYLIGEMTRLQANDVVEIDRLVGMLDEDAAARPLAEEALGAAKGHLESLSELLNASV